MALVRTTLSSAVALTDKTIVVASATGFTASSLVRIDSEDMIVDKSYVSGTTIPVIRGQGGTATAAHAVTAGIVQGVASDWGSQQIQTDANFPIAGRAKVYNSYSASGAITLPPPGSDGIADLNAVSTTILQMTVADPTKEMDGCRLLITSHTGTGAHTITFANRLNAAGSGNYTVFTFPAGPVAFEVVAVNSKWFAICGPAWTGTVTLLTGGIA